MRICYTKSRWEYGGVPLETFLDRVAADGFDGVELCLHDEPAPDSQIRDALQQRGLLLVAQVGAWGHTAGEHFARLDAQITRSKACGAISVNVHSGSDFFTLEENLRVLRHAIELGKSLALPVHHETHRGLALFNLPQTLLCIEALPELLLTADFSHFMCVHESELRDREDLLERVIAHTRHIHARVGFSQGPQVAHPLAPERAELLARYLGWWKKMLAAIDRSGASVACITPEAGPAPYMPVLPFSGQPVADAWTVNVQMKDWLKPRLATAFSR